MATIHPSRSGLVPASDISEEKVDRERERDLREKLELSRRKRNGEESSSNRNGRGEGESSSRLYDRRYSPSNDRHPQESYRREPPPPPRYRDQYDQPPHLQYDPRVPPPGWQGHHHDQEQGPPPPGAWGRRQEGGRPAPMQGGFQENRNEQRKASTLSIWPASPTSPYHSSDEEDRRKSSTKHKISKRRSHRSHRSRKYSDDDENSEEEERRRQRKRREKEKSRANDDLDIEEEERRRRRKRREKERDEDEKRLHRSKSHKRSHKRDDSETSDVGRKTKSMSREKEPSSSRLNKSPERSPSRALVPAHQDLSEISEPSDTAVKATVRIGPQLPQQAASQAKERSEPVDHRAYGKALLPGEGSAMANFVQEGKRIPRRGEIGLSSDQIETFEKVGYVMSGSRHQRMNAVRMRKENQIISAEEQRSILRMRAEEKQKKEAEIVAQVKLFVELSKCESFLTIFLFLQFKDMVDSME